MRIATLSAMIISITLLTECMQNKGSASSSKPDQAPGTNPYKPIPYVKIKHPEWTKNATIYQINTRQFTDEGTFRAAEKHLPRLKALREPINRPRRPRRTSHI